jgi:hypothetical protein
LHEDPATNHRARNPLEEIDWSLRHGLGFVHLTCSRPQFTEASKKHAGVWIGFYSGQAARRVRSAQDDLGCAHAGVTGFVRAESEGNAKMTGVQAMRKQRKQHGPREPQDYRSNSADQFPAIAKYVKGYGHIEIGDQEGFGFVVRALDYGGLVFEDHTPSTLVESMTALEKALAKWFDEQGIDLE